MLPRPSIIRPSHFVGVKMRSRFARHALPRGFAGTAPQKLEGPMDNAFNRERLAVKAHAAQSAGQTRSISRLAVVIPALILASLNAKNLWDEHWEHWEHMPPLEDRVQYPYMNIRTKAYPWGDGDKTLL
ncbi:Cytochrome c oxidase subunit 6A [Lecanora helva]